MNPRETITTRLGRFVERIVRLDIETDMAARERYWEQVRRLSDLKRTLSSEVPGNYPQSFTDSQALRSTVIELERAQLTEPRRRVTVVLFDKKPLIEVFVPLSQ